MLCMTLCLRTTIFVLVADKKSGHRNEDIALNKTGWDTEQGRRRKERAREHAWGGRGLGARDVTGDGGGRVAAASQVVAPPGGLNVTAILNFELSMQARVATAHK